MIRLWKFLTPAERHLAVALVLVTVTALAVITGHTIGSLTMWWLGLVSAYLVVAHFHLSLSRKAE